MHPSLTNKLAPAPIYINLLVQLLSQTQRIFEQGERTGRLLAWLARERASVSHIANIRGGDLLSDPQQINARFTSYYKTLYTSRAAFSPEALGLFLDRLAFLVLSDSDRASLDSPITLKEVQVVVTSLQTAKSPGPDGIPAEFYKTHAELVIPRFHALLLSMLEKGDLPPTMSEVVIVVIPKPNKDPDLYSSYRPISLLNVNAKIVTKILANRLNSVILTLVQGDQTGFMPGKGTDINIRRLYTHISLAAKDHKESLLH